MFRSTTPPGNRQTRRTLMLSALVLAGAIACNDTSTAGPRAAESVRAPAASSSVASRALGPNVQSVNLDVFAPENGHHVGQGGAGWFVDMEIGFPNTSLAATGFTGFELTGPGGHANIAPFPRPGGLGQNESNPGLLVICSTSTLGAGANLAGLFNLTGITDLTPSESELWATWIVAGPACGVNTNSTMSIAIVADLNGDGIFNDAPNTVPDANGDGKITPADVRAIGLASNLVVREFFINP